MAETHPNYYAKMTPDKPAVVFAESGEALTYRDMTERAARAAGVFEKFGLRFGDVVAILMENQIRFPELVWAAKNSGLRYVAISTQLNAEDVGYIIGDSGAKLILTSARFADLAHGAMGDLNPSPALLVVGDCDNDQQSLQKFAQDVESVRALSPKRGASMLYSSGTTGRPKGVKTKIADVSPETPPQRFWVLQEQFRFDERSVFINPGPFYHAAPLRFMMTVHRTGGTVVAFEKFDAERTLTAIDEFGGTHGFFVPTMFRRMLALNEETRAQYNLGTMRHAIHAAAPCPRDTKYAMIEWWGPIIDELYSGTESIGHTFITSEEWLAHPGSVGKPSGNCKIRIVDCDGRILPPNTPGRIEMSNGLAVEYHGEAAARPLYNTDGYASLGDVGYLDGDGYLYLTDRENDMIIAGGVNIYPQETERALLNHPEIIDVCVFGRPDDDMGEEVAALIQLVSPCADPAQKAAQLAEYCRGHLSKLKSPRSIVIVDAIPRNELGKVAKHKLRDMSASDFHYRVARDRVMSRGAQ